MIYGRILMAVLIFSSLANVSKAESLADVVSEVRVGILRHDIDFLGNGKESGADLNAEVLFGKLDIGGQGDGFAGILLNPQPHLGIQVNTAGDTSQIYAGLTWRAYVMNNLWVAGSGGGAFHNGNTGQNRQSRKSLGSSVLFRLSGEIGYDISEDWSVSLYYDHESNAGFADSNEGLNNSGVRFGWRF